jgi:hypothetical protein
MKGLIYIAGIVLLAACGNKNTKDVTVAPPAQEVNESGTLPPAFNTSFKAMLGAYYSLRDALVAADTALVNQSAEKLALASREVRLDALKTMDTANIIIPTAKTYTEDIASQSKAITAEPDIEQKRKSFQLISGGLFDLVRTVRYGDEKVYLLNCPMAFNNTGANWLSNSTDIKNPYFGNNMLTCGSVVDSVVLR